MKSLVTVMSGGGGGGGGAGVSKNDLVRYESLWQIWLYLGNNHK